MPTKQPLLSKCILGLTLTLFSLPLVGHAIPTSGVESFGPILATNGQFTNIPTFNTNLGTLISVSFKLELDITPILKVINSSSTSSGAFTKAMTKVKESKLTLSYPTSDLGTVTLVTNSDAPLTVGPEGTNAHPISIAPGQTLTYTGSLDSNSNSTGPFTDFTPLYVSSPGHTSYDLGVLFKQGKQTDSGSTFDSYVSFGGTVCVLEYLTVDYDYFKCDCSVPEPSTWALMGMSLAGLFVMRRFQTKRVKVS